MIEKWMIKNPGVNIRNLSEECDISKFTANLCANRGLKDKKSIDKFLKADIKDLYDGFLMKDSLKGVEIIKDAIMSRKKIVIYGDYDCDGVISTFILYKALTRCGALVSYYIPDREQEGYGMNSDRIVKLKEQGYDIILTCDNGISAFEQVKLAVNLGFQVVVTDHHDIPYVEEKGTKVFKIPNAHAVINPKQSQCEYPFKNLCGAGIALKFSICLYERLGINKEEAYEFLEYAAIGTVCDVVDLLDENRIIVKNGLIMLNNTKNLGLKALIKETGIENKKITAYHLGFIIGPEINATGRLESANLALELLLSETTEETEILAKRLHELNIERQLLTTESVNELEIIIEQEKMYQEKVILVYNPNIHESIAGIAAGRIKEKYNLPTIVLTKGKDMPKGSGRSIDGYNMFEELSKGKHLMVKFGGHPMAAGLSLQEENIPLLRMLLIENCTLTSEDLIPKVRIDASIPLNNITYELINEIEKFEPFGKGNPTPLFAVKDIRLNRVWFIGKEKNIIRMRCKIPNSDLFIEAISFDKGEEFKELIIKEYGEDVLNEIIDKSFCNVSLDFTFYPSINEYNGFKNIQLIIKNLRLA